MELMVGAIQTFVGASMAVVGIIGLVLMVMGERRSWIPTSLGIGAIVMFLTNVYQHIYTDDGNLFTLILWAVFVLVVLFFWGCDLLWWIIKRSTDGHYDVDTRTIHIGDTDMPSTKITLERTLSIPPQSTAEVNVDMDNQVFRVEHSDGTTEEIKFTITTEEGE